MATNRTLQFLGYALGTSPVQITASINDTVVFTGPVETLDPGLKYSLDASPYPVLFSVDSTDLFPTTFSGSYPVTMTVTGGDDSDAGGEVEEAISRQGIPVCFSLKLRGISRAASPITSKLRTIVKNVRRSSSSSSALRKSCVKLRISWHAWKMSSTYNFGLRDDI